MRRHSVDRLDDPELAARRARHVQLKPDAHAYSIPESTPAASPQRNGAGRPALAPVRQVNSIGDGSNTNGEVLVRVRT